MKKTVSSIDLTRFILAYFVLVIHFRPFSDFSPILDTLSAHGVARIAVPFYLMTAGYFLNFDKITETIRHYFKLYMKWSLAYIPFVVFFFIYSQEELSRALIRFVQDFLFQGTVIHLWYLPQSALALLLFNSLKKRFSIQLILMISFGFYFIGVFADAYSGFILPNSFLYPIQQAYLSIFLTSRNALFFALFYIVFGYVLKDFKRISFMKSIVGFLISLGLMMVELLYIIAPSNPIDYNYYFSLIPTLYFFYQLILSIHLKDRIIYAHLRHMASNIYFSHMLIFYLSYFMFSSFFSQSSSFQRFLIVSLLSTFICGMIELKPIKRFKRIA